MTCSVPQDLIILVSLKVVSLTGGSPQLVDFKRRFNKIVLQFHQLNLEMTLRWLLLK